MIFRRGGAQGLRIVTGFSRSMLNFRAASYDIAVCKNGTVLATLMSFQKQPYQLKLPVGDHGLVFEYYENDVLASEVSLEVSILKDSWKLIHCLDEKGRLLRHGRRLAKVMVIGEEEK